MDQCLTKLLVKFVCRILDNTDESDILLSLRNVYIRFNAITNIYHRY